MPVLFNYGYPAEISDGVEDQINRQFAENRYGEDYPYIKITQSRGERRRGYDYRAEHEHSRERQKISAGYYPLKRA